MSLTNLQHQWQFAASQLELRVKTPYSVLFRDGSSVEVEVHLHGYGARKGMLVLSDYRTIEGKKTEIMAAGFGYSCYGPVPEREVTSLEGIEDMLGIGVEAKKRRSSCQRQRAGSDRSSHGPAPLHIFPNFRLRARSPARVSSLTLGERQ